MFVCLFTIIVSRKERERDLDFLHEDTIIPSFLSSFSLRLFLCHPELNVTTTFLHREEEVRDLIRGADFWS